ncbi:MAG: hypothetical protein SWJ54_17520, partial [Cyanobacteriota bacterium]|nr:hypothetical protein [Cyanobacteriota bacterium]
MNLPKLIIASAVIYLINIVGLGAYAQTTVTPSSEPIAQEQNPAPTYQPGFWQPVARVNPNEPITVNITNQSGVTIEYSLTTGPMETRVLANGTETELAALPKDSYIIINPKASSMTLKHEITTDNNTVYITVEPGSDFSGE